MVVDQKEREGFTGRYTRKIDLYSNKFNFLNKSQWPLCFYELQAGGTCWVDIGLVLRTTV